MNFGACFALTIWFFFHSFVRSLHFVSFWFVLYARTRVAKGHTHTAFCLLISWFRQCVMWLVWRGWMVTMTTWQWRSGRIQTMMNFFRDNYYNQNMCKLLQINDVCESAFAYDKHTLTFGNTRTHTYRGINKINYGLQKKTSEISEWEQKSTPQWEQKRRKGGTRSKARIIRVLVNKFY